MAEVVGIYRGRQSQALSIFNPSDKRHKRRVINWSLKYNFCLINLFLEKRKNRASHNAKGCEKFKWIKGLRRDSFSTLLLRIRSEWANLASLKSTIINAITRKTWRNRNPIRRSGCDLGLPRCCFHCIPFKRNLRLNVYRNLRDFASKITCSININSPNRVLLVSVGFKVAAETFSEAFEAIFVSSANF